MAESMDQAMDGFMAVLKGEEAVAPDPVDHDRSMPAEAYEAREAFLEQAHASDEVEDDPEPGPSAAELEEAFQTDHGVDVETAQEAVSWAAENWDELEAEEQREAHELAAALESLQVEDEDDGAMPTFEEAAAYVDYARQNWDQLSDDERHAAGQAAQLIQGEQGNAEAAVDELVGKLEAHGYDPALLGELVDRHGGDVDAALDALGAAGPSAVRKGASIGDALDAWGNERRALRSAPPVVGS